MKAGFNYWRRRFLRIGVYRVSIRPAEKIIEFAQKALEQEDLERRLEELEARIGSERSVPMKRDSAGRNVTDGQTR